MLPLGCSRPGGVVTGPGSPRLPRPASSRLGRFGTPRPATGSAGSRPARGTPGPGGPGRSSRSRRPGPRAGNRRRSGAVSLLHQQLPGPVEPDDAGGGLRRQPDLGAEPAGQVPLAPAGPGGQLGHPDRAALPQQLVPGPADLWCYVGVRCYVGGGPAEQDLVQHREPLRPAGRGPDPVAQLGAHAAEDGLRGQVEGGELAGRQAEQRPRAQRPQRHLDAGLRARVRDQGGDGVQAAEQGAELAGRLPGVGMRHDRERLVQGEDQRQVGRRQAAVPGRRHPALPVAGVGGHVAAQRLGGDPAVVLVHHHAG